MVEIIKKKNKYAANYGQPMLYYIPEWDDRVDPNYDFINDNHTPNRDPYSNDVYAHEIYDEPTYDGILLSKVNAESTGPKKNKITKKGVHDFLRFPKNKPIMGDCGAFSYIDEYEPPYETREIINYYSDLGFDYGVSIDHLIVGKYAKDKDERIRRYELTKKNAEKFINLYNENNYDFVPIGVAQGWDKKTYKESVDNLIQMGYKYIALGGLAKAKTKDIFPILENICSIIPSYLKVHLFGVSRIETIKKFRKLGVTSFDSASFLRRAWLSSSSNYITSSNKKYAAVRVPQVENGRKVKTLIKSGQGTKAYFKNLEKNALKALRNYENDDITFEEVFNNVMKYEEEIQIPSGILKVHNKLNNNNIKIDKLYDKI
ncbi:MAG: tRNA-guanine transglycosylase DpdA, partial [Bacillota bacterium]